MTDPVEPEKEPRPRRHFRPVDIVLYVAVGGFAIYLIVSGLVGVLTKAS